MAGSSDYLLGVMSPDLEAHEKFLKHQFTRLRGVAHIQTAFSLSSLESVPSVPLAQQSIQRMQDAEGRAVNLLGCMKM